MGAVGPLLLQPYPYAYPCPCPTLDPTLTLNLTLTLTLTTGRYPYYSVTATVPGPEQVASLLPLSRGGGPRVAGLRTLRSRLHPDLLLHGLTALPDRQGCTRR